MQLSDCAATVKSDTTQSNNPEQGAPMTAVRENHQPNSVLSAERRLLSPPPPQAPSRSINHEWLAAYERLPESIFNYYSVENEIDFLKKTASLPRAEREFYIEENVKRFLGEFVGKIPYTTIPYMLHTDGFNYGGMHVMDSYRRAAELGTGRERAETEGFAMIENQYLEHLRKGTPLPTAVWISPPKSADYGFVFVMQPDDAGRVREYIVRYDEKRGDVTESNRILRHIDPAQKFGTTDEFLLHPLFLDPSRFKENLPALLHTAGVNEDQILKSGQFEAAVSEHLADWIRTYSKSVLATSGQETAGATAGRIDEAKSTLLAVYAYAERLRDEAAHHHETHHPVQHDIRQVLTTNDLEMAYLAMQQNAPTVNGGGSCPVVKQQDGFPGDQASFISNSDMLRTLASGKTLEDLIRNKTFPCPKCGFAIPAGEGRTSCPKCGITKDAYAREQNGKSCD